MAERTEFDKLTRALDQVGLVVADLEHVKAGMATLFGIEPRKQIDLIVRKSIYRGREVDGEAAVLFYDLWGIEFEFISPRNGENVWQEFLDERGGGLHHLRFQVEDQDAAIAHFAERGITVAQVGDSSLGNGVKFVYYDTLSAVGFIVETFNSWRRDAPAS
jgi:methylmalonyl-CoA/ethylmalonyl-CoA epimerase